MSRREIITVRSDATKIGVVNSAVASIRAQRDCIRLCASTHSPEGQPGGAARPHGAPPTVHRPTKQ